MNRVGLAVVVYKKNYGSMLQAYATQAALARLGTRPEVIPIGPFSSRIRKGKARFFVSRLKSREERLYLRAMLATEVRKRFPTQFASNIRVRNAKYSGFLENNVIFGPESSSISEVVDQCRSYRAVIVGSDQLWRPSNIEGDFFTLNFVPRGTRRIAYATSFGVAQLPKQQWEKAGNFLSRFDHISVREETGKALVKSISGREVPVVCDPSMLLDAEQWSQLEPQWRPQAGFILCYFLGANRGHRLFAQKLAAVTGLRIVALLHGATFIPDDDAFPHEARYDVGPAEFLTLVRKAEYVCTDSFHGTVFSILFQRKFFSFARFEENSELSTNDRLKTLLGWCGLNERLLSGKEDVSASLELQIDYDAVLQRVAQKRQEGMTYLQMALGLNG